MENNEQHRNEARRHVVITKTARRFEHIFIQNIFLLSTNFYALFGRRFLNDGIISCECVRESRWWRGELPVWFDSTDFHVQLHNLNMDRLVVLWVCFRFFFFLLSSFFVFVCFANNNVCCLTFLCVYHCGFCYNELFSIGARSISIERFVCILRQREYFPVVCCVCLNFICIYCASLF